jgi:hypothetical protein
MVAAANRFLSKLSLLSTCATQITETDEKLTAFLELERAIYEFALGFDLVNHFVVAVWSAKRQNSSS